MRANATLSRLLIADLAQYLGMTFKYPDRLTRAEANEALNRARAVPGVVAVALNTGKPERIADNVASVQVEIPPQLWRALKDENLLAKEFPYFE